MTKRKSSFQWVGLFGAVFLILGTTAEAKKQKGTLIKIVDGDTVHVIVPGANPQNKDVLKVRYLGMDTPETHFVVPKARRKAARPGDLDKNGVGHQQPWGDLATTRLHELVNATPAGLDEKTQKIVTPCKDAKTGKPVEVEVELFGHDSHERTLGFIYANGVNTNLELVKEGWAYPYLYCAKDDCQKDWEQTSRVSEFVDACKEARTKKLGVFDAKEPMKEIPSMFRRRLDGRKPYQYLADYDSKKLYDKGSEDKIDPCTMLRFDSDQTAQDFGYKY